MTAFVEQRLLRSPLRWGMVGGGQGSQIGYSHRDAAARDLSLIHI